MTDPAVEFTDPGHDWNDIAMDAGVLSVAWKTNGASGPVRVWVVRPAPAPSHLVQSNGAADGSELVILPSDWVPGEYSFFAEARGPNGATVSATRPFKLLPRGGGNTSRSASLMLKAPTYRAPGLTCPRGVDVDVIWETRAYNGKLRVEVRARNGGSAAPLWQVERDVSVGGGRDGYLAATTGRASFTVGSSWPAGHYRLTVSITSREGGRDITLTDEATFYVPE